MVSIFTATSSLASVSFRAAASASSASNGIGQVSVGAAVTAASGNVTPPLPATLQVGDLVVCLVESYDNVAHTTATVGWTQLYSLTGASVTHRASLFYRIAAAANTALTVTHTGGSSIISRCTAYRGADTTTPFDIPYAVSAAAYSASDLTVETGSVTPVSNGVLLLFAAHIANQPGGLTVTTTGGLTWTQSFYSSFNGAGTADLALGLNYATQTTAVLIGPLQATMSSNAGVSHGVLLALNPAATPLTINLPANTGAGDVMIASVSVTPNTATITAPAGWTLIRQLNQIGATTSKLATYYRVASATEPAVYVWTLSGGALISSVGGIATFSGVDNTTPIDVEAGSLTPAAGTSVSHIAPTVTTTLSDGMLVTIHELASSATWTPPAGMTEATENASLAPNNAAGISMQFNYEARPTAGATGTRTAVASANADRGATQSISLRPTPLICYTDDFNRANGAPGTDWIVSNSGGTFGNPAIAGNRLRLTDASGNAATMATLQRLFPGSGNRIEVEFQHYAYGGTGADGIAIALSDSAVTATPGGYGGSLGYAQNTNATPAKNGFGGGWIGIGIDEYGNFSSPTEGRVGGPGLIIDSISVRGSGSGTTGYAYHTGTATLVPQVDNNGAAVPAHKYRVIVDHSNGTNAWVSLERDTGAGYVMLIAPYDAKIQAGQAAVPASWVLSYTGSTGGSTNIHEIDGLRICATSQTRLVNHYAISHSGTGVNCQAEPVTITAHDVAHSAATLSNATTITLSTSTGLGDWSLTTGAGTLNNGTANDGIATYQFGSESAVVLGLKHTTPAPTPGVNINVTDGTTTETSGSAIASEDNRLIFAPSGFRFTDGTNPVTIGAQSAGKESNVAPGAQNLYLQAIRIDTNTGACVGVFASGTSVSIGMASQCNNPTTCIAGQQVRITNNSITTAIASNPNSGVASYTNVPLLFGANSQAPFSFNYTDVGSISLYARYNIPLTGGGASPDNMLGSSNAFVVKPDHFVLSNIMRTSDSFANPAAANQNGTVFIGAGQLFSATVTAANLAGNPAPNYGKETTPESVRLTSALVLPVGGTNPAISYTTGFGAFTNGVATGTDFKWNEVGIVTLTPGIGDSNYLGAGDVTGTTSGNVGRFTPDHFNVVPTHGCTDSITPANSFTYSGQPFRVTATPFNALGATTLNYTGALGFAKIVTISDPNGATNCPSNTCFANNDIASSAFANVSGVVSGSTSPIAGPGSPITYTFLGKETAALTLTLRATEKLPDLVSSVGYDATTLTRSGRIHILNAYGSELVNLPMPMRVEYYSATDGWLTNATDACSSIAASSLSLSNNVAPLTVSPPTAKAIGTTTTSATLTYPSFLSGGGDAGLSFSAPLTGGEGYVDVTADLSTMAWLRFDWDGVAGDDNPTAKATFGLYKGNPRHIYLRERY